ncbi:MAG: hypothetical protein WC679_01640 [Bacteroidales bacterium]|jgi:hypothetical protein
MSKFKVGDKVYSDGHGKGKVKIVDFSLPKPIGVKFKKMQNHTIWYTQNGYIYSDESFSHDNIKHRDNEK